MKPINYWSRNFCRTIRTFFLGLRFPFLLYRSIDGKKESSWLYRKIANLENAGQKHGFGQTIETKEWYSYTIIYDKRKLRLAKILQWLMDYPLQPFIFNSFNWLDEMPEGWRKAFGIQMCKEIKQAIIRTDGRKGLKKYHIQQIKEKFGELRWYDTGANTEVQKIIMKYEYISSRTCIKCGRPATVQTTGWICPYCDDCVPEENTIDFGMNDYLKWYGYTGNINNRKDWKEREEAYNEIKNI